LKYYSTISISFLRRTLLSDLNTLSRNARQSVGSKNGAIKAFLLLEEEVEPGAQGFSSMIWLWTRAPADEVVEESRLVQGVTTGLHSGAALTLFETSPATGTFVLLSWESRLALNMIISLAA
jgi:hypothetical protein